MTKTDFENLYRFIACISAGKEYFDCVREPMVQLQKDLILKHLKADKNRASKRNADKIIEKELVKLRKSMDSFDKRIESLICQFDLSDDPKEQAMIDTMIDHVTESLKSLEIEIKD